MRCIATGVSEIKDKLEGGHVLFWQNSEGFGTTTRFNVDRAINERFLLRWNNLGKWTQETTGLEWFSELTQPNPWYKDVVPGVC